jgi:hypothetical protein
VIVVEKLFGGRSRRSDASDRVDRLRTNLGSRLPVVLQG